MKKFFHLVISIALFTVPTVAAADDFIEMVEIPAGTFYMGGHGQGINFDEAPIHKVTITRPFRMSVNEVTNAQYEAFRPDHRALRGKNGVSTEDRDAVVNVSYNDAVEFCRWLSHREGKNYRLPTEAEWEYACKAGSYTPYSFGSWLPDECQRSQRIARDYDSVSLATGITPANPFGLRDMHGNVEEWCLDFYAAYSAEPQINPCGPAKGEFRVTRGGSHHTPMDYLRSTNRMAMLPDDRHSLTGFRIVESDAELLPSGHDFATPSHSANVDQRHYDWPSPKSTPFFERPKPFVIEPACGSNVPFYAHNHQPALTWCDNGDLLAIWFSANAENGREVTVLASRLRPGAESWDEASEFLRIPDRNLTGSSLLNDGNGRLIHINGVEAAGDWQNLAMVMRESRDCGATWSPLRIIAPEHTRRHQVIAGPIITPSGDIIQACDAGPGSHDGAAVHISHDGGLTWSDSWDGSPLPDFARDSVGTTIAGIHAGIVTLADGSLMAMGRGNAIPDSLGRPRMPISISHDGGATWHYRPSAFTPIDGGQRLVLLRLNEGPLLLISFTEHPERTPEEYRGMEFTDSNGNVTTGHGLFAAVSYDDGLTWPVRRLLTTADGELYDGGAWTGHFIMTDTNAEPKGYLAATQTPDNTIHLLSSRLHYRFNLPWLENIKQKNDASIVK